MPSASVVREHDNFFQGYILYDPTLLRLRSHARDAETVIIQRNAKKCLYTSQKSTTLGEAIECRRLFITVGAQFINELAYPLSFSAKHYEMPIRINGGTVTHPWIVSAREIPGMEPTLFPSFGDSSRAIKRTADQLLMDVSTFKTALVLSPLSGMRQQ